MFIVEGDSAGGSARGGRDPKTQAILPIRGRSSTSRGPPGQDPRQQGGQEAIINALGTGIREDFDLDKLRYRRSC